jgi:2-haloacid dehalogenase
MQFTRRDLMRTAAIAGLAATPLGRAASPQNSRIRAVAFDAFTVFDPRPVFALAERTFPTAGKALVDTWRTRQFEYAWLRTLTHNYVDFWQVTGEALTYAAKVAQVEMTPEQHDALMHAYLELTAWPDAKAALTALKDDGYALALLSNFSPRMMAAAVEHSGLSDIMRLQLSTDRAHAYKPDPRAYRIGIDTFALRKEQIAFAAFAGWDAAGAKRFGYPTFWVNRLSAPVEELGATPDAVGKTLTELVEFVKARK